MENSPFDCKIIKEEMDNESSNIQRILTQEKNILKKILSTRVIYDVLYIILSYIDNDELVKNGVKREKKQIQRLLSSYLHIDIIKLILSYTTQEIKKPTQFTTIASVINFLLISNEYASLCYET